MGLIARIKQTVFHPAPAPSPDAKSKEEVYIMPLLAVGEFDMTAELRARQRNEELCRLYKVSLPKEGELK